MVCNLEYFRAVLVGGNCTIPGCFYCSEFLNLFLYNNAMIELKIPGRGKFELEYLVCDVNGTLAVDGQLQDGVIRGLTNLKDRLSIHLLTADTFGRQAVIDRQLNLEAVRIEPGEEAAQKTAFVRQLGPEKVVAIGQGANDAAVETLLAADMVVPDIMSALDLLEKPLRVVAGLRK